MEHLEINTIVDGLEGRLSSDEQKALRKHISGCQQCAELFSQHASLLDALSGPELHDAPEETLAKAFNVFEKPSSTAIRSVTEIVKTLLLDSWSGDAAMGLRGGLELRQVGMSTEDYDLHLSINYSQFTIHGQLLPKKSAGFVPEFQTHLLDKNGQEIDANISNEFGEFLLTNTGSASILTLDLNNGIELKFEVPEGSEK